MTLADSGGSDRRRHTARLETIEPRALRLIPESVARALGVVPLRETDRVLFVAASAPIAPDDEEAIAFAAGRDIVFELGDRDAIAAAIEERYASNRVVEDLLAKLDAGAGNTVRILDDTGEPMAIDLDIAASPVVRLTSLVLQHAVDSHASEVHLDPSRTGGHVRLRVNGETQPAVPVPQAILARILARLKIMAGLDITAGSLPQQGLARIQVEEKRYDLRISTVPGGDTERMVIQLLEPGASVTTVAGPGASARRSTSAHVLVTDDDPMIRLLARRLLEKAGMTVTEAADGEDALAALRSGHEFSLVLLDLHMRSVGGLETLRRIRASLVTAGLPVIVLTGSDREEDEIEVMDAGADDYVRKPIVPDRVLTRIRAVLRRAAS